MKLSGLLNGVDILDVSGDISGDATSLCYDSRECKDGSVFVAVSGAQFDGHDFVHDAVKRGARYIVYDEGSAPSVSGAACIQVGESRLALAGLAKNFYGNPSRDICLIGVTGTNGKTTVTYFLESILKTAGFSVGVIGTVNYRYGGTLFPAPHTTPESLDLQRMLREMVDAGVTHVVMEVSSHAIDLKRIYGCEYDLGIFTNLSREHLDYHRTMEEYFLVKKRFFDDVIGGHTAVVNGDDPWGARLREEIQTPTVIFGVEGVCDVSPIDAVLSIEGIDAKIRGVDGEFPISSTLAGGFNLSNILAATAAALSLGVPQEDIRSGIGALDVVPGRLERVSIPGEPVVFVDYAHTGDALEQVLKTLSEFKKKRIITVFGCGGDRDRTKRPGMGRIAAALSDLAIITSDNPRTEDPLGIIDEIEGGIEAGSIRYAPEEIASGFMEKGYTVVPDRREAIALAVSVADDSDIVLVAGKGHEDYQIMGTRRFPFDDRVVVREALSTRRAGGAR
ncbi:MAG: UDP-N-acetylmuramoyl-L-alanyl-D-glutamate--2,6-diaminopimelate ligase [Deltaproteobacteria bacterium]|nr:UDP-N-acetylmuramoyl-L-alanyl-D-glutamate--2,6-diaminopimelate ligase [Deltaproteobacteria bacterium]